VGVYCCQSLLRNQDEHVGRAISHSHFRQSDKAKIDGYNFGAQTRIGSKQITCLNVTAPILPMLESASERFNSGSVSLKGRDLRE
jgi:hypothetical protein